MEMTFSPDGRLLYVVASTATKCWFSMQRRAKLRTSVPVGHVPRGIAVSSDGKRLYVTNSWADTVSVIDAKSLKLCRHCPPDSEPTGVVIT